MQITPFSCTIPGRQAFQSSPYNSNQQLPQQAISLSLSDLKCPVLYAKQCHMSHCQYFGQAPLVCLKGSCACWPCQCPLAQKSHHHRVTESQRQRNYSQARSFSPQGHIHSQTHSLKSSSFTCVNSELKLFSWITEIYNGRFVNEKRMSNVNSQPWLKDR